MLINTVYEKPIDTVDDFINSGISKMPVGEPVMHLFEGDKRENVQRMAERVYEFEFPGYFPEWLADGQVSLTYSARHPVNRYVLLRMLAEVPRFCLGSS